MTDLIDTSVRLSGVDDLSPILDKAGKGFDALHSKAKGGSDAKEGLETLSKYTEGLIAIPTSSVLAVAAIEEFARRSVVAYANVVQGMNQIRLATGASSEQLKQLSEDFDTWATRSGRSTEDLEKTFQAFLANSNQSLEDTRKTFDAVVGFANVTGSSIEEVGRAVAATINNLKISPDQVQEVMGAWLNEIPPAMIAPFAAAAPKISETLASIGIHGEQAATDFALIFTKVAEAIGNPRMAASALDQLFTHMTDLSGPLGQRMLPVLEQLHREGGDTVDALAAMVKMVDQQLGADPDDPQRRSMVKQMFGLSEDDLRVLEAAKSQMAEIVAKHDAIKADLAGGLTMAQALAKEIGNFDESPLAAVNALIAGFEGLANSFGAFLNEIGVTTVMKDLTNDLNSLSAAVGAAQTILKGGDKGKAEANTVLGSQPYGQHFNFLNYTPGEAYEILSNPTSEAARAARARVQAVAPQAGAVSDFFNRSTLGPPPNTGGKQVPHMARGGVVTEPTLVLAGEAGAEKITPLTEDETQKRNTAALDRLTDAILNPGTTSLFGPGGHPGSLVPHMPAGIGDFTSSSAGGVPFSAGPGFPGHMGSVAGPPGGAFSGANPRGHTAATSGAGDIDVPPAAGPIDRSAARAELAAKPWLRDKLVRLSLGENSNPLANQSVMEETLNRAAVRGTSVEEAAKIYGVEAGGYSAGYYRGNISAKQKEMTDRNLAAVLAGSDVSHGATDNSSGGLAEREAHGGQFTPTATQAGEHFWTRNSERGKYQAWQARNAAAAPQHNAFSEAARQHSVLRTEMERPIKMNVEPPQLDRINTFKRRITRQQSRWQGEDVLGGARYGAMADVGFV